MPKKEAVVLILDANASMSAEVDIAGDDKDIKLAPSAVSPLSSSKTRFDYAKELSIAIISDLMVRSKTNEATVVVLHTETTNNYFHEEDDCSESNDGDGNEIHMTENTDRFCPFPNITEISGNGEAMGIRRPLPDLLRKIHQLKPTATSSVGGSKGIGKRQKQRGRGNRGDFESGLVYAADALHRRTAGKQFDRRIVLLTDAEHRIGNIDEDYGDGDSDRNERKIFHRYEKNFSQQRLLVAVDILRAMACRIQVVGMDFEHAVNFDKPVNGPSRIKNKPIKSDTYDITGSYDDVKGDMEIKREVDGDDGDDDEDDILEIKVKNEEYLIRLANAMGGFICDSKEKQCILKKILTSRATQNPSKRKLVVQIAPGLVLENARYYKLISKTPAIPLKKKLVMINKTTNNDIKYENVKKNTWGDENFQDYETTITHWNAEDENEELLADRRTYAYRFGSDLLPYSMLDDMGLRQRSPVKMTILGYVPDSSIPHFLRIGSPYVLTGNESRRCCAAISALAIGLRKSKQVAIATFVTGAGKDEILCGLFPLLGNENGIEERGSDDQKPLRLIFMQLPFSGDVRYPYLDNPDGKTINKRSDNDQRKNSLETRCDDLIDKLILPQGILHYKNTQNHKVRSFYKTIIKRVLDKNCDVVPTRIDSVSGIDSMDTPFEIRKKAQPAVTAFYESFHLKKRTRGTAL